MPTIKLGLDPLGETEFGVIMLFLGILRMGVVTWSVNMHKDTDIFLLALTLNLKVFKESQTAVPAHHSCTRLRAL